MSSNSTANDVCYVVYMPHGEMAEPCPIYVRDDREVKDLKRKIRDDEDFKHHLEKEDLFLFKCNESFKQSDDNLFSNASDWLRDPSLFQNKMAPTYRLKEYFPTGPAPEKEKKIDIMAVTGTILEAVRRPSTPAQGSASWSPAETCPRETTVSGIWDKLMKYRFIWARGTPGSGKSTLANLLRQHAKKALPEAQVIMIDTWMSQEQIDNGLQWREFLRRFGWRDDARIPTVILIDEAQTTYRDNAVWLAFFKSVSGYGNLYVIGFASYGSAMSRIDVQGSPVDIPPVQRISLRAVVHNDGFPAVGLLFTEEEFTDTVRRKYECKGGHRFDEAFLAGLFQITGGHIGAIIDVLRIIESDDSYRTIRRHPDAVFTWDMFEKNFSPDLLVKEIWNSVSVFSRGLPKDNDLQDVLVFKSLSAVVQGTVVTAESVPEDVRGGLQYCTRRGWIYSDNIGDDGRESVGYCFASSLHQWYIGWKLFATREPEVALKAELMDFVLDVLHKFDPRMLSKRIIGPACVQRPLEAQYQDEFHRSSHIISQGSLLAFPEFGTGKGRVDFYVPSKKWGIELLRDGDRLAQHSGRFSQPGTYRGTFHVAKYVILDCRTTVPQKEYSNIENLYHVVFKDNYQEVTVLDNRKQLVKSFRLLGR